MQTGSTKKETKKSPSSKCDECPLKGRLPCLTESRPDAVITVVGEGPSEAEEHDGKPFIGAPGKMLDKMARGAGIARRNIHITNAVLCKPHEDLSNSEWKKAIACCAPRLKEDLAATKAKHVIAFGDWAQYALTGKSGIWKWMGTEDKVGDLSVLSTLHPAYVLRLENAQNTPIVPQHFNTLVSLARGKLASWEWPTFHIHPNDKMVAALEQMLRDRKPVGFDVENVPSTGKVMCLSIANEDVGISCPWDGYSNRFGDIHGLRYYTNGKKIYSLVRQILEDAGIEKIMQNGQHDLTEMKRFGITIRGFKWDTMLMHAIVYPPLKHTLNFIAAQYTHADRWKDTFKAHKDEKGAETFIHAKELELREYNAKDSLILPILHKELRAALQDTYRGLAQYEALFERAMIALHMKDRGVPIEVSRIEPKKALMLEQLNEHKKKLTDLWAAVVKDGEYNPGSNKDTKKLFLEHLKAPILARSKESGNASVDRKVLAAYQADLNPMVQYAATELLEYRKWKKLYGFLLEGSINGVPVEDGVCHTDWKTHGTRTGRWTSPLLILPKKKETKLEDGTIKVVPGLRDLCTGFNGNWFIEADYASLELVVVALLAGDQEMLDIFRSGGDIHREVAKGVFNTPDPSKGQRGIVKTFNYGLVYGASDSTLWKNLRAMGATLSIEEVAGIRELWFKARPAIDRYLKVTLAKAYKDDYVEAPLSGRRYYFYGKVEPAKVYNNPVQMTAADLINQIFPAIYKEMNWQDEGILYQYHDAVILDTPNAVRGWDILHKHMTQEVTYNGAKALFAVDIEIGKDWESAKSCTREEAIALDRPGGTQGGA